MNYRVIMYDLPTTIRAMTVENPDGGYTVFINSKLNFEQQRESFLHELKHINNNDFQKYCVDEIETIAHRRRLCERFSKKKG